MIGEGPTSKRRIDVTHDDEGVPLQVSVVSALGPDAAVQIPGEAPQGVPLDTVDPAAWQLPDDDDAPDYTRIASLRAGDTTPTVTNASDDGGLTDWPGVGGATFDAGGFGADGGE